MYTILGFCDVFPFEFFVIKIDSMVIICDHCASYVVPINFFLPESKVAVNLNPILKMRPFKLAPGCSKAD